MGILCFVGSNFGDLLRGKISKKSHKIDLAKILCHRVAVPLHFGQVDNWVLLYNQLLVVIFSADQNTVYSGYMFSANFPTITSVQM